MALLLIPARAAAIKVEKGGEVEASEAGAREVEANDAGGNESAVNAAEASDAEAGEPGVPEETDRDAEDLLDEIITLFEMTVVGKRPLSQDPTQDSTLVEGETIRDSPRQSTFEALSQEAADVYVPGRGVMHGVANGATGGIHIRGLGGSPNSQVLVVEDGVPDYHGVFGHPIPDAYTPFLIDDVLVVKGGDSVLYGTNAMGGVVLIRSRWRDADGYEVLSDAAYGSYATLRESVAFLGRFGSLDAAGAITVLSTDGHRQGAGGDELIASAAGRYRFTPSLDLTVRNKVVHLRGADPGSITHPFSDHWYDVWRDTASLRLGWRSGDTKLHLTPYVNVGVHRLYDGFHSTDYVGGANAELELKLHRDVELLLGASGEHVGGSVEDRIAGERPEVRSLSDVSFYNQLTLRPIDRLSVVLGTREVISETYGFVFLYKGGVRWDLNDRLYVRSRIARNFRQPTIRELYLPFPTANPDLRPEKSLNLDVGIGYRSERFELSLSGYRTEADDLIRYFGSWPSAEVINIGNVVISGVEGALGVRKIGPLSAFVTANLQDVGKYTRQNPRAKLNFNLDHVQTLGEHRFGASLSGEWVHGLYMGNYSRDPIDDVFVMDLSLRYRYGSSQRGVALQPYLYLRNLLDSRYAYVEGYPMPSFNLLAGLRIEI